MTAKIELGQRQKTDKTGLRNLNGNEKDKKLKN